MSGIFSTPVLAKVCYTAKTPSGDLAEFEEPCTTRQEADAYAARVRALQTSKGLPVDARVEVVHRPITSFVLVEFRVVYTCLDRADDEVTGEYDAESIHDAAEFCDRTLAYQEAEGLPLDARIVFRVTGGGWQPWARLAEQAGAAHA